MRLRVATLLITGLLFSSALAREAPRPLTLPEVVKQVVQPYVKVGPVWLPLYNRSISDSFLFGHIDVTIDSPDYQVT